MRGLVLSVVCAGCFLVTGADAADETVTSGRADIVIADFEGRTYGDWQVEGEAFGPGPAKGTLPNQMQVSGYRGSGLVNSYYKGDGTTGVLTSPPFIIERRYLNFLIGGGMHPGQTCMDLLIDGRVVRTATGPNDRPGGSEALAWHTWDVADLQGRTARLRIVDKATGGWGHINIDHILLSDRRFAVDPRRTMRFEKRYLNLPVKTGAPKRRFRVRIDGRVVREFEIELADREPDFWVFLDLTSFRGRQAVLEADALGPDSKAMELIHQAEAITGAENLYHEKDRQQFHFSSRRGWNNDSNGLVYYDGEYHLYYQHNPYGWAWGNMHWGHAVSTDLVHWKELPIAIYPHRFGDWVFSGSAVVDADNTAGFKTGTEDIIVAAYTSTGRGECIAYSNDRGRTFTDYEGNPVVKHRGRDPKVIWYAPGKHWVMAVYDEWQGKRYIAFYTSPDLKTWQFASRIEGFFECPEIFELPVQGQPGRSRWVLYAADGNYRLGDFDGRTFSPDGPKIRFQYGNCFYASQTYNNIPPEDGRRIQIAWGRVATPGMPFNQCMLFPVELTLRPSDEGLRMFAEPIREIRTLHDRAFTRHGWSVGPGREPLTGPSGRLFHLRARFRVGDAKRFGLTVCGTDITYEPGDRILRCRDRSAPLSPVDGRVRLELLVDRNSIEIFANAGRVYMPIGGILEETDPAIELFSDGAETIVESLDAWTLRSIWP